MCLLTLLYQSMYTHTLSPFLSSKVIDFIASHNEIFVSCLKEGSSSLSLTALQELSLVTAVVSQCRAGEDYIHNTIVKSGKEF